MSELFEVTMEHKNLTLGSLFSGSGGFELAGMLAGITPVWNSEIEPYPVLVTHNRLPNVQHFGDVSKLNGAELPPVDVVTFGSPCQDYSEKIVIAENFKNTFFKRNVPEIFRITIY